MVSAPLYFQQKVMKTIIDKKKITNGTLNYNTLNILHTVHYTEYHTLDLFFREGSGSSL